MNKQELKQAAQRAGMSFNQYKKALRAGTLPQPAVQPVPVTAIAMSPSEADIVAAVPDAHAAHDAEESTGPLRPDGSLDLSKLTLSATPAALAEAKKADATAQAYQAAMDRVVVVKPVAETKSEPAKVEVPKAETKDEEHPAATWLRHILAWFARQVVSHTSRPFSPKVAWITGMVAVAVMVAVVGGGLVVTKYSALKAECMLASDRADRAEKALAAERQIRMDHVARNRMAKNR